MCRLAATAFNIPAFGRLDRHTHVLRLSSFCHNGVVKPFDPRLLKYAESSKRYIVEIAVLGVITAALVIAQAFLISASISPVISQGARLNQVLVPIGWLVAVISARALLVYIRDARAHRAADQAIESLREEVTKKAVALGPRWRARHSSETTTLLTRGLNDLEPYYVDFLPQLLLVVTVTPMTLLTMFFLDVWSAVIAIIVIPLIPIFMVLIGKMTVGFSSKKLVAMERLGAQLLDMLTGIPTLRALGREEGPRSHLVKLSKQNTRTTMATLRVAFLSGGVLEFMATLSVALVAVQVGMRMVTGEISLFTGLIVITLAPDIFDPLRSVGTQFHASTNGVAAAEQAFDILEEPTAAEGEVMPSSPAESPIVISDLYVASRGRWAPAALTGTVQPGKITALAGPSGTGKSTTVQVLLGFEPATRGTILIPTPTGTPTPISEINKPAWWKHIAWVPQHPTIVPGTVASNVLGAGYSPADAEAIARPAAEATGFAQVVDSLPKGWDTPLGSGGEGLSVGQRQRLALTRILVHPPELLVLDEPTAHLDAVSEEQVVGVLRELRDQGTTILVIAHRKSVIEIADEVLTTVPLDASESEMEKYPELQDDYQLEDLRGTLPPLMDVDMLEATRSDE